MIFQVALFTKYKNRKNFDNNQVFFFNMVKLIY